MALSADKKEDGFASVVSHLPINVFVDAVDIMT